MTDAQKAKLDAFLKQAVASNRPETLSVMIRLVAEEGAGARVGEVLTRLDLKVKQTLSDGRLLVAVPGTLHDPRLRRFSASARTGKRVQEHGRPEERSRSGEA